MGGRMRRACVPVIAVVALAVGSTTVTRAVATPRTTPAPAQPAAPASSTTLTQHTFANPPTSVRPKYRWWMPLAYTDDAELRSELDQMKAAGAGGAEVAPFGVDGTGNNTSPFLDKYGFGTPLWADKVRTMLAGAKADDLSLDLTIGPRWPATVPTVTDVNDPAASQQIVFTDEFAKGGTARDGTLPTNFNVTLPAGAQPNLIAALVARCTDAGCATQTSGPRELDRSSVRDVTSDVAADGSLHVDFPGDAGSTYALMAFYRAPTGQSLTGYTATGTNYVLDTLSAAGAHATTDFYDQHILTPSVQALVKQMGSDDLFEDSLELGSTEKWTPEMVAQWTKRRGYSPVDLLPALAGAGDQGITAAPTFDFGDGVGTRVRTDYRQTLSDLYIANRLDVLRAWAHRHHLSTRIQPYGVPVDISAAASHIDVPEGESLAFGQASGDYSNVQDYKVVATGAHLSGEKVVSDECCAFSGDVWGSTAGTGSDVSNLAAVYRGLAGGVNQVVWHGFPYLTRGPAGAGSQEVWPGMSYGGNTSYSEAWGAKGNPNWSDYRAVNDNLARLQLVLRQGQPRFDVGVYWQDFGLNGTGTTGTGNNKTVPGDSAMAKAGYTYEYVSPAQLTGQDATYEHGRLFGDTSAYHAVELNDQTTMTVPAATSLLRLARQGLPVVVSGHVPSTTPGYDASGRADQRLQRLVGELLHQPTVVRVAGPDDVPAALAQLKVRAAAAHATASDSVLDVRRHGDGVDYYYLFNQSRTATAQTLTLTGSGVPYRMDTWTGKITPITDYRVVHGRVVVPVTLAGNDSSVIALTARHDATFTGAPRPVPPPTGTAATPAQPLRVDDWSLSVDSVTPGPSDLPGDTAHTTLGPVPLHADANGALPAWSAITPANGYPADLSDVSGVGTYTAHVQLDRSWRGVRSALLDLGTPVDTVRVAVNGRDLPPLDQADLRHVDVGTYLHGGANTITVRVASTLLNAVRVAPGTGASSRARMDYGLFGPVRLTPAAGRDAMITAEPLQDTLPLADRGVNQAQIKVTNPTAEPVRVTLAASGASGITAAAPKRTTVRAGSWAVVPVEVRDQGVSTGTSTLGVTVRTSTGLQASTALTLENSADLALNPHGTPYPRIEASPSQDRYPAELAADGSASTFYVSWGRTAGQGPTAADPVTYGVDFGAPVTAGSVTVGGRSNYGARDYDVQVSDDGEHWRTVAGTTEAPKAGSTTTFPPTRTRYLRISVTRSWDAVGANVQISEFAVAAA